MCVHASVRVCVCVARWGAGVQLIGTTQVPLWYWVTGQAEKIKNKGAKQAQRGGWAWQCRPATSANQKPEIVGLHIQGQPGQIAQTLLQSGKEKQKGQRCCCPVEPLPRMWEASRLNLQYCPRWNKIRKDLKCFFFLADMRDKLWDWRRQASIQAEGQEEGMSTLFLRKGFLTRRRAPRTKLPNQWEQTGSPTGQRWGHLSRDEKNTGSRQSSL